MTATQTPAEAAAKLKARVAVEIGPDLLTSLATFDRELASANPFLGDLQRHTARFRGKQLRPTLLLLTAKATGGIREEHHTTAAVIEMIHVATLVHDDVLDEADVRRHVSTVNARWNNETSVLFGDYLFTHAFHLAASLETTDVCRRIGRACSRVCEGELTQVRQRGNLDLTEEEYFDILDGKTAELCAISGELGARGAGASEEVVAACELYGRRLGLAFQIADDLLDLDGDVARTGKTAGTDLTKQKLTLPLIRLLATADAPTRSKVVRLLEHPNEATRTALEPFFADSDAMDYSRGVAERFVAEACDSLRRLPESSAKLLLLDVAQFAARRQA